MLMQKLLGAATEEKLYADDVFQAVTRTGTGADAVITTGIDMTKGYMLWSKGRSGATDHAIYDSARGVTKDLVSNSSAAETTQSTGLKAVSATGHTVGSLGKMNTSAATYVDFVFRKAPKFFDVVTYVGDGVAGRQIPHALGIAPGMVIVKNTSQAGIWGVYHRSIPATDTLQLESTAAKATSASFWNSTSPTTSVFSIGTNFNVNNTGDTYVAYLFAHDTSTDGIVQCGSFTTDGSGAATVNLGWEPQYWLVKSFGTGQWEVLDTARDWSVAGNNKRIQPNSSAIEDLAGVWTKLSATGVYGLLGLGTASQQHIYLAIRRPNKPPTTGTQVYNAIARTGTGAAATVTGVGFAPDLVMTGFRNAINGNSSCVIDRLRGANKYLLSNTTISEDGYGALANLVTSFDMTGITLGADINLGSVNRGTPSAGTYVDWFFRRAPGVMDVVCFTGTPSAVPHSLGVVPELMIQKKRGVASDWYVTYGTPASASNATLQSTAAGTAFGNISASQTSSTFYSIWGMDSVVAYLFATKAGISKVGSYTGNGTSQTIDCGFTTGARFVLIKATSTTGDWLVGDSTRGLVAGNDPRLSLNTTAAEVTTEDWLDPHSSGFIVNQVAGSSANASGVSYIVLAFA